MRVSGVNSYIDARGDSHPRTWPHKCAALVFYLLGINEDLLRSEISISVGRTIAEHFRPGGMLESRHLSDTHIISRTYGIYAQPLQI